MSQFMEVIEWLDDTGQEIVHRWPEEGSGEIKLGAQLVVRPSQAAVFFRSGRALDVVGSGRHTLTTLNLPILTKVLSLPWGFTSPFRAEVYFVNLKVFTNLRWGTKDPVAFRDSELGLVRLRAFGAYTMQVSQPLLFVNSVVGTQGTFATADIEDYLREVILSRLTDHIGEKFTSLFDLPPQYDEMAHAVRQRLTADLAKYGVDLLDFVISRITPPEDVQRMIDTRAGMSAVGDLDAYLKFQAANALVSAAGGAGGTTGGPAGGGGNGGLSNGHGACPGGAAGAGLELGVGAGLGMMLPGILLRTLQGEPIPAATLAALGKGYCPECHAEVSPASRFCPHCGHHLVVARQCPQCAKNVTAQANFCPACGHDLSRELRCAKCDVRLPAGTRFCFRCGEKVPDVPPAPPPHGA